MFLLFKYGFWEWFFGDFWPYAFWTIVIMSFLFRHKEPFTTIWNIFSLIMMVMFVMFGLSYVKDGIKKWWKNQ